MSNGIVAPHAGAWIETNHAITRASIAESHPMRVRGLKRDGVEKQADHVESHPMRVRGLKRRPP